MLEACENIEFNIVIIFYKALLRWICQSGCSGLFLCSILFVRILGLPLILIKNSKLFFNIGWKIIIFGNQMFLLFSFKVVNRVKNRMKSDLKLTELFSLMLIQQFRELNDWKLTFGISSSVSVSNQFQNTILNEHNSDLFRCDTFFFKFL